MSSFKKKLSLNQAEHDQNHAYYRDLILAMPDPVLAQTLFNLTIEASKPTGYASFRAGLAIVAVMDIVVAHQQAAEGD